MVKLTLVWILLSLSLFHSSSVAGKGFGFVGKDLNGAPCTGQVTRFNPIDYRTASPAALALVEDHHFTPETEHFIEPAKGNFAGDYAYTLKIFPNHHRALLALIRLETEIIPNLSPRQFSRRYDMEKFKPVCYLNRALAFAPDDSQVQQLMGFYLHRLGRLDDAEEWYRKVISKNPNASEAHYNLGLLLVESEKFDDAMIAAEKAYSLGYPLPGLRNKLEAAGHPLPH